MTIEKIGSDCSGCSLCVQVCGKKCISMQSNNEGFLYPIIDHSKCVDCGLCYKKCPCNGEHERAKTNPQYYAAANNNSEDLLNSSSGGLFIAMSKAILKGGGYVCGCVFDKNMKAVHICTNKIQEVERMMGSKYVQSTIEDCLPKVKELLVAGHKVLFTGTACQNAAVKEYIKNRENLYLVDILCHGVPSPLFFSKYVDFLEEKHQGKLTNIDFRNKKQLGWGSEHRTLYTIEKEGITREYIPSLPAYFCSFFWGTNLRESCYKCHFAGEERITDITIGDFWGYWTYFHKKFPKGISIASVNTKRGEELIHLIDDCLEYCINIPADKAKGTNTNFYHSTPRPKTRDLFYEDIENKSYKDFVWSIYLNRETRKKMLVSIYGRYMPQFIKTIITSFRKHD
jgi:Pyruvate/2-oxoacid:ferredoxin oxidoreductase delta subunit